MDQVRTHSLVPRIMTISNNGRQIDMHIYLENPPLDQGERWSGRPFRALSVVHPPNPVNLDPTLTSATKQSFLENLWSVQARYRTRLNQSVLLCAEDREVENRGGKITRARTYFNVYQRTAFLKEEKKVCSDFATHRIEVCACLLRRTLLANCDLYICRQRSCFTLTLRVQQILCHLVCVRPRS